MDARQELAELRRLEELEAKLASQDLGEVRKQKQVAQANAYAGEDVGQMGTFMRGLGGAKVALDKAAMGLKGIFTDLTDEDKALLEGGKAFVDQGGAAATVGNIGGEIAMTAAPALRLQRAVQGARMLPQALRGAIPSAAVSGGVTSAAMTPEDRGSAAVGGALGAAGGEAAGRVLTRTLGGLVRPNVSADARVLMDQGVPVPMWRAMDDTSRSGRVLRDLSERGRVLPVAGDIIRGQERRAFEGFNRTMAARATPPAPVLDDAGRVLRWENRPVQDFGPDAMQTLRGRFDQAYDALYAGRGIPVDQAYGQEMNQILQQTRAYFPRVADEVAAAARQADDILRAGTETTRRTSPLLNEAGRNFQIDELGHAATRPESLKQAIDSLETRITSAWRRGDGEAAEALQALKGSIEDLRTRGLPPEVADQAAAINRAYASFKQLERATGSLGAQTQGVTTPRQMLGAIKANDRSPGKSRFARGQAMNQEDVLRAERVLGSRLPETGPGTAEKLLPAVGFGLPMMGLDAGASLLLGTQTGQRALMGGYPIQAAVRRYGNQYLVPALRQGGMMLGN